MTWFWFGWALIAVVCVAAVPLCIKWPWSIFASGIAVFVSGMVMTIFTATFYVDRSRCSAWEVQTGRQSKFVTYNAVQWACLAQTQDGTWLPIEQLREFGEQAE